MYKSTRAFIFPSETRFAGKLLQIKRFLSMKEALQELVRSAEYRRFQFEDDVYAPRIDGAAVWILMDRIAKAAGPLLLLLRLADSNAATLSKLKGTVDYLTSRMVDNGNDSIEDKISTAFHNRRHELECDISNAAYVLDQEFVAQSRMAGAEVMSSFWKVARSILRCPDDTLWRPLRLKIVAELAKFRMKTDGFAMEDYNMTDTCAFWGAAGCNAPTLRRLAFCLCALPCSSGEAERNWQEVKENMTKNRNRLARDKIEKMVFVRRFTRLKRKLFQNSRDDFSGWMKELLQKAKNPNTAAGGPVDEEDGVTEASEVYIFQDVLEPGEQGKINGKEPGEDPVNLTTLRQDNAAKSWLFEKYYNMCFTDKNPQGHEDDDPLDDPNEWEHRIIRNVVWSRRKGYVVETALHGDPDDQSIEHYEINDCLLQMIRVCPHNMKRMASQMNNDDDNDDGNQDGTNDEIDRSWGPVHQV